MHYALKNVGTYLVLTRGVELSQKVKISSFWRKIGKLFWCLILDLTMKNYGTHNRLKLVEHTRKLRLELEIISIPELNPKIFSPPFCSQMVPISKLGAPRSCQSQNEGLYRSPGWSYKKMDEIQNVHLSSPSKLAFDNFFDKPLQVWYHPLQILQTSKSSAFSSSTQPPIYLSTLSKTW